MTPTRFAQLAIASAALTCAAAAQDAPPPPPAEEPASDDPLPSLDDLLDLPEADRALPDEAPDEAARELERALREEEINDRFAQAADFMLRSADRLDAGDTGLVTQRLQEDALERLDWLIENADQQESESSSSSSSSQQEQGEQQQPSQSQQQQAAAQSTDPQEGTPPGARDAELAPLRAAAEAAWGSLPERVRGSLLQGAGSEFSDMYRALTERYYRRLAEEGEQR